jgi:hypothetical protein
MSFFPSFAKTRVYENILYFRTLSTHIRTWVERDKDGPSDQEDWSLISDWIGQRRMRIDDQPLMETAEQISREFPRIVAIEVLNGSKTNGVLIYPRWP